MIDLVIPVRDRENDRIQRCVDWLRKSKYVGRIILVDYGSEIPAEVKDCEIIYVPRIADMGNPYKTKREWNKGKALNIGIRRLMGDWVGTVDCDSLIPEVFFEEVVKALDSPKLITSVDVRRIDAEYFGLDYEGMLKNSRPWHEDLPDYEGACGGIQIYPREWIFRTNGVLECLPYWGGMDTEMLLRAELEMPIIKLPIKILHQEHDKVKEQQLSEEEREEAKNIMENRCDLIRKLSAERKRNKKWGEG